MVRSMIIIDTNSCMNSCLFCNPERKWVKIDNYRKYELHMMRQALDLIKAGLTEEVEISGCDPIEYPRIAEFIKWLKSKGYGEIQLSTHGRLFKDEKIVEKMKYAGLDSVRIPLYGSNAEIHDSITQEAGSFDDTIKGLENLTRFAPGIKILGTSLIMKQNYNDIIDIIKLSKRFAGSQFVSIPCISELSIGRKITVDFFALQPYLIKIYNYIKRNKMDVVINDIPFCVFGFFDKIICNKSGPPQAARSYRVPKKFRTGTHNLPQYRLKQHIRICNLCDLRKVCNGFYVNYLKLYNTDYLVPL